MVVKLYWTTRSFLLILYRDYARSLYHDLTGWLRFWRDYQAYTWLAADGGKPQHQYLFPRLGDNTKITPVDPVYYYQDAWAFERIAAQNRSGTSTSGRTTNLSPSSRKLSR